MLSFLRKNKDIEVEAVQVDIHSHLLPGLDDGVKTYEEALHLIQAFYDAGYKKLIITPHVYPEFYPNTADIILKAFNTLKLKVAENQIAIDLEVSAEYYLDDEFTDNLSTDHLLTFGNKYLLFETSFLNKPVRLDEIIFKLKIAGYQPVMAHPERYTYIHENPSIVDDLYNRGVLFQLNINSLAGAYSPAVMKMASKMINKRMVHFLGSDCHHINHLLLLKKTMKTKVYKKALSIKLLNNTLL